MVCLFHAKHCREVLKDAKVYVAEDGKAKLKTITVESSNNNYLEVISGIKESG